MYENIFDWLKVRSSLVVFSRDPFSLFLPTNQYISAASGLIRLIVHVRRRSVSTATWWSGIPVSERSSCLGNTERKLKEEWFFPMVFSCTKNTKILKLWEFLWGFLNSKHEPTTNFHINFIFKSCVYRATIYVKVIIVKSFITDVHTVDGEFSSINFQFHFGGCVTWTGSTRAILVIIFGLSACCWWMKKHNPVFTASSLFFVPGDLIICASWSRFCETQYNLSLFFLSQYNRIFKIRY